MTRIEIARAVAASASSLLAAACIPYTVGTTARPTPPGEHSTTTMVFAMPSVGILDSSAASPARSISTISSDYEARLGLDSLSDIGIRFTSLTGIVLNYKRLVTAPDSKVLVAVMPGAGIVNMAEHAHFELTVLASAWEPPATSPDTHGPLLVPFGGLRVMQVLPLAQDAVHDQPTIGVFAGLRIGSRDFGISPELGVFHDHSALHVRKQNIVFVPAISFHGNLMPNLFGGRRQTRPVPPPPGGNGPPAGPLPGVLLPTWNPDHGSPPILVPVPPRSGAGRRPSGVTRPTRATPPIKMS